MSAIKANYFKFHDGIRVRVMCPKCGSGGSQYLDSYQPKCSKCEDPVLMEPANNGQPVCTWAEAVEYSKFLTQVWAEL